MQQQPPPPIMSEEGSVVDKERFLQDLARVVPSLSIPGPVRHNSSNSRGTELLHSIMQAAEEDKQSPPDLTSSLLKSLLQVGGNQPSAPAAHTVQDPAIKQRGGPKSARWKQQQHRYSPPVVPPPMVTAPGGPLASAEALVARSLLRANPSPFHPPQKADLTELNWDEEGPSAHWPVDDETIFYKCDKLEPSAEQEGVRGFYDLNIVMPLIIPGAEIRVLNADGENYYNLAQSNPGAHLLFGRETRIKPATTAAATGGKEDAPLETDDEHFAVQPPTDSVPYPAVCDVWATFLNAQLGTIRNCRANQVVEICQLFNAAFSGDEFSQFMVPITVDCRGIYPVPRPRQTDQSFERYETRGVFLTENDRRRFRIIRRRLKKFVLMLWDKYGVQCEGHKFDVALGDNCRSTPNDAIHIEIRRYGALSHPQLLKHIWNTNPSGTSKGLDLHPVIELPDLPPIPAQARVVLNEVRLEMTHARMVDPRWPHQWVLARRMPAIPASSSKRPVMARYVFCSRVEMPKVVYEFSNPKKALLKSRFSPLYLLADVSRKDMLATLEEKQKQQQQEEDNKPKLSAAATPFYPLSAVLNQLGVRAGDSTDPLSATDPLGAAALGLTKISNALGTTNSVTMGATHGVGNNSLAASLPNQLSNTIGNPIGSKIPSAWERLLTSATIAGVVDGASGPGYKSADPADDPFARLSPFNMASLLSPGTRESPVLRNTPPITEEPCKFYRAGVCARGDACYFLHPADPQLEIRTDIRHLSPANPIFF
eukprot:Protomagalhaensia_sp_Gyna_25__5604@NODE_775_length_2646_cov_46_193326_g608_i0_p1_GENE_NODE_775_length_2646_cov_46_193326_g608_i0NODE_775_length_2646_cov_46_193326_g608_i0_p1_ORF_typecomplete_len766_score132_80zfCCCH/PF00642_24/7_3e03zfCCCH/PF00642_24/8_4e06zf_CCCH_4/PF18345_1/9_4e02zf_CCCH_4/PF18345_1/0_00018zfCCCH_4/PF18044_1/8_2e02zfCCCH_4/PF18044_1/0_00046Torus/PF16131_5/1_8e04Torus/PF16131_5/0_0042zfCCCH_3/PF15663_5/0_0079zfCCCH_2/PF14608_6/1_8e04zfCCCH_2/PF14608_6/0_15_NODE_775_length_2646_